MSFEWPLDKLAVCNRALALTGDNTVSVADDGSDEWNCCSPAYETAIGVMMEGGDWGYASQVVQLQSSPTAPQDTQWNSAYPIPSDCVNIIWVKVSYYGGGWFLNGVPSTQGTPGAIFVPGNDQRETLYDIAGTPQGPVIVTNAYVATPVTVPPPPPPVVTMKYISNKAGLSDSQSGTPTFVAALQHYVMSGIYRGLHEDPVEAASMMKIANEMVQVARFNYARQKPKRAVFNSRMQAARLIRRPWPPIGNYGWGSNRGGPG